MLMNAVRRLRAGVLFPAARSMVAVGFAVLVGAAGTAHAGPYPDRPIRLVVPFGAGTTTDMLARQVGEQLSTVLGQRLVIENKAGAGGTVGAEAVAKSPPDGYTLLWGTGQTQAVNVSVYKSMRYDPLKDFEPIARIGSQPLVLVAAPSVGIRSLDDLLAKAKSSPDSLIFASTGLGSSPHLAAAMFNQSVAIDIMHVPYANGQALPDLLTGRTTLMFYPYLPLKGFIDSGELVPLASTGDERLPELPQLPTMREAGYPKLVIAPWYAVYGPAGMPADIVALLEGAIRRALADKYLTDRVANTGTRLEFLPARELAAFTASEINRSRDFVAAAGAGAK
ncbi:Bug family tripartite tricarboxylate transporter substrate binding protein [Bosea thiooxidans]